MSQYLSYFRTRFIAGLQYRLAAFAGIFTQFFFGIVFILIYKAFYESGVTSVDISLEQLITYLWLQQAFYSLFYLYYKDSEILSMIRKGDVAYELARPGKIYFKWFAKVYSSKMSACILRFIPIIIVALLLPSPYKLLIPSLKQFILFITSIIFGSLLITAYLNIINFIALRLLDTKGIVAIFAIVADILAGSVVPLPLLQNSIRKVAEVMPFRYMADLPYRIFSGNIVTSDAYRLILVQVIWLIIFVGIGYILSNKVMKKLEVQGG